MVMSLMAPRRSSRHALLMVLRLYAASSAVRAPITGCLNGVDACRCEWVADDTDATTLAGLSHPGDYSAEAIDATGLPEAVVKAADTSPQACERVCCEAVVITDAPAAAQGAPQTGPCGVWHRGGSMVEAQGRQAAGWGWTTHSASRLFPRSRKNRVTFGQAALGNAAASRSEAQMMWPSRRRRSCPRILICAAQTGASTSWQSPQLQERCMLAGD